MTVQTTRSHNRGLANALGEMRDLLGDDNVLGQEEAAARYIDPYKVEDDAQFAPGGAVRPTSAEDVQEIVRIANRHIVALSPISTGRNNAYGGSAPRMAGAVVVDLGSMNRVLEVDEELGYALVEPGVSYLDLHAHLREIGSELWVDTADLGWGSVLGNALERGVGFTPYGDHFGHICGMEVVLPEGDLLRTGMGGIEGNNTWGAYKYGFGPYVDGLFSQSNLGIVTKIGIWLMKNPGGAKVFMVGVPREEDLEQCVDIVRELKLGGVIRNQCTVRHVLFDAATMLSKEQLYSEEGPVTPGGIREMQDRLDLGYWNLYAAVYGDEVEMQASLDKIASAYSVIPGARLYLPEDRPGPEGGVLRSRQQVMTGQPNLNELKLLEWIPNGGHIDVSPILPMKGADAWQQYQSMNARCRQYGHNYFSSFIFGNREIRHIATFLFDTESAPERENVLALAKQLVSDAADSGYGEYRGHIAMMDEIAATFSWNEHAQMRFYERLKDALDPNGVLAPGKQGVWPARLRTEREER
ncbi:FAD-binding oxidoreductase [Qaidamihabitans albus]|uniref:FAD-binding oxidoreductase n=1 Tax=Qaidamihabitans albus TaxID=2795733 RepID=UPI0018F12F67|nr:FAD-binding oxidoreductase [Qaidamihabitans albus]